MLRTVPVRYLEYALLIFISTQIKAQPGFAYRLESEPLPSGAELLTIFQHNEASDDLPLVSILRDTLGDQDPENDRLRYVWVLAATRPSLTQRVASAIPFASFRFGTRQHATNIPKPVLDLGSPAKGVWSGLITDSVQVLELDPMGALVRSSTRSYRGNAGDYRRLQVFGAARAVEGLLRQADDQQALSDGELRQIYSRLQLSNRALGGLVRETSLPHFYDRQTSQIYETRGHNWELLRQRAELCGLYFEPVSGTDGAPREALLWISRNDLETRSSERYERQFLNIANPWTDDRLLHWTGYSEVRYFDSENRVVDSETPGARPQVLIPLALYSLEYPRVPLLVVDFRDGLKPKQRELGSHAMDTILTGVLGLTGFSNWPFVAANAVWHFVRIRRGATLDHSLRLEAYSRAREVLDANSSLDTALKIELITRLEHLALNPLENSRAAEETLARNHYSALVSYAGALNGLNEKLSRDRQRELRMYRHSASVQALIALGQLFTARPPVAADNDEALRVQLDSRRRIKYHMTFLSTLLASSPRPEVMRNTQDIRKSIQALADEVENSPEASRIVARLLKCTEDSELRIACVQTLSNSRSEQARGELRRIVEDPEASESLRTLCSRYLNGGVDETVAGPSGTQ